MIRLSRLARSGLLSIRDYGDDRLGVARTNVFLETLFEAIEAQED